MALNKWLSILTINCPKSSIGAATDVGSHRMEEPLNLKAANRCYHVERYLTLAAIISISLGEAIVSRSHCNEEPSPPRTTDKDKTTMAIGRKGKRQKAYQRPIIQTNKGTCHTYA